MTESESMPHNPFRSIRVFVSSRCGDSGRFDAMRQRLADRLESTSVFQAYLWERGGASSMRAKEGYISEINDSDICIVVIDNADGVPQGVRNEVDHILRTNKRALFIFCNELSDEKTDVQGMLEGPEGLIYKTVNRMDDVPEVAYRFLQEDVLLLYRKWCNHDVDWVVDAYNPAPAVSAARLPKAAVSSLPGLREVFGKLVFGGEIEQEPIEGLDTAVTQLAKAMYLDLNVEEYDASDLVKVANSLLPKEYAEIVETRWVGICRYLNGQIEWAQNKLDEALDLAKSRELASWFVNDILIDLRNISSNTKSFDWMDGKYQKQLTNANEDVVYPLLDRAVSEAYEVVEKDRVKEGLQGFSTFTIGDNAMRFFDSICKSFAVAACFGSLTHLSLTLSRLRYVVYYLCQKYQDANLNASLLKLSIVCGKRGEAERTLQALNNMYFDSDSESAKGIINFCTKYRCMNTSEIAPFEAFGVLGLYLQDADFSIVSADFVQRVERSLANIDQWEPKPASIFRAMKSNANRLQLAWMIDVATRAVNTGYYFWQKEALAFLRDADIDLSLLDARMLNRLLDALRVLASSSCDGNMHSFVCDAAVVISASADVETLRRLDEIVAALPDGDRRHYKDVCGSECNDSGMANLIERGIEHILADNERQGVGGAFFYGASYHIVSVERIKSMAEPSLDLGRRLYSASMGTLASATYDCGGKINACEAMCRLLQFFGRSDLGQQKETEALLADIPALVQCHSVGKETKLLLNLWIDALSLLAGNTDTADFCTSLARCYRADYYTQVGAGNVISCLCQNDGRMDIPASLHGFLFAYACYLAKSYHFQLNLRGLQLLSMFVSAGDYRVPAAQALFDGYARQSPRGKIEIIDSIPLIREVDSEMADELCARVLRDNTTIAVDYLRKSGYVSATIDEGHH